tara:strand:+ start:231 stop:677 length:447 start_codon:yes stop_codon:yes gene_type:complete
MNNPISNINLHYAISLSSNYNTIDDLIYNKYYKKDNFKLTDSISGVKSYHSKYLDKLNDKNNFGLNEKLSKINDNITICDFDYSNQIKNILSSNNNISQLPGYTSNNLIHESRYIVTKKEYTDIRNNKIIYNKRYNRNIPLSVSGDFL